MDTALRPQNDQFTPKERLLRHFVPCLAAVWNLRGSQKKLLHRWNAARLAPLLPQGRFSALAAVLADIDRHIQPIAGLDALAAWVENAPALTDDALAVAAGRLIDAPGRACLTKALAWSRAVDGEDAL
ncbi:MAG: hypothetical protein ACI4OI_07305 [Gemmiger sp.]